MENTEEFIFSLPQDLLTQAFIDKSIAYALTRNPDLSQFDNQIVTRIARDAAHEIATFEETARKNPLRIPETPEDARRIKAIWDLSGPGTYFREFKEDRYKDKPWAAWMDRRRLSYSGALMRRLTERITGRSYKSTSEKKLSIEQVDQLRSDIERFGPYLIYNGAQEENEAVERILQQEGVVVPQKKVHIINGNINNTIDQVKYFNFPDGLRIDKDDVLVVVCHAPQMMRAIHMMNRYKPFPEGLVIQPHPLPSPPSASTDYAMQEISGLLYYTLVSKDATEEPYPYIIL